MSVVIPVHNRERYVLAAINSVLTQGFADFEIIVIDDGSTDGTAAAIERLADPRVRLVRNSENLGIPRSRNRGIEESRGKYIAWLDSDDLALPGRLQLQVDYLERMPGVALIGSWAGTVNDAGRWMPRYKVLPTSPQEVEARLLLRCPILQYSMTGRADVLKEFGYAEDFPVCQDFDLFVRLAERHGIANLPQLLVRRRFHSGRVTREKADLVKTMNQRIVGRQIEALGISPTPEDLDLHFRLPRVNKEDSRPNLAFLTWAEDWCGRLNAANDTRHIYEPRTLRRSLGHTWFEAAMHAMPAAPIETLAHIVGSPLRGWAGAGIARYLSVLTTRPFPDGDHSRSARRARGTGR